MPAETGAPTAVRRAQSEITALRVQRRCTLRSVEHRDRVVRAGAAVARRLDMLNYLDPTSDHDHCELVTGGSYLPMPLPFPYPGCGNDPTIAYVVPPPCDPSPWGPWF